MSLSTASCLFSRQCFFSSFHYQKFSNFSFSDGCVFMTRGRKGAPKQKWTSEEEAALKAGVDKHGAGKWRIILSDPKYGSALKSRSNVDLKDKWRNIIVINNWGSRKKAKDAAGRTRALTVAGLVNATPPPATSVDDEMILEAIKQLKKPRGPNEMSIILFIKENFNTTLRDLKRIVTSRLEYLTDIGMLVKMKQKYKISPDYLAAEVKQRSPQLLLEGNKGNSPKPGEVVRIKDMTVQEAAEAAARAVAEADFAIREAEKAAREAEKAEAEAEAAQTFAEAIMEVFKYRVHSRTW